MEIDFTDIVLVEDNTLFRNTLVDVINQSSKMRCEHAFTSAEEALETIGKKQLAPGIILLDIGLPGMSGIECIGHIKSLTPASKIVILTIHDDDDNIFQAICSGASGYLLKDAPSAEIINLLEQVLFGGAPMNAHIAKKVLHLFQKMNAPIGNYNLTGREKEILKLLVEGLSKKQIASQLFLSFHTIDTHIRNIYQKLEVHTRSRVVAKALKEKLF